MKQVDRDTPRDVDQAVKWLASSLSYQDRSRLLHLDPRRLGHLYGYLIYTIRSVFYLSLNPSLMESCRRKAGKKNLSEQEACELILGELKKRLYRSGALRIVK